MLAGLHGQIMNYSELGRSFGLSDTNIRNYVDILTETFMVRQLQPWHENIGKRQVRASKIYLRDSGLLHELLALRSKAEIERSHFLGASWEGYALEEVIRALQKRPEEVFFWRTHTGAELDLFLPFGRERTGIEFKFSSAPHLTPSMRSAKTDLKLKKLFVLYPGNKRYLLSEGIEVVGLQEFLAGKAFNS
jgi:predicted AAA+ superfamily ATPase